MNKLSIISRFLVATIVMFSAHISAIMNVEDVGSKLRNNRFTTTSTFVSDHLANKNEHAKKAFIETVGHSLDKRDISSQEFAEHLFINYGIRKSSEILHDRGITADAALKKVDVLPEGMVRNIVNPVVEGAVEVATHPETLTVATLYVLSHYVIPALTK
jgi:hypothetical protein